MDGSRSSVEDEAREKHERHNRIRREQWKRIKEERPEKLEEIRKRKKEYDSERNRRIKREEPQRYKEIQEKKTKRTQWIAERALAIYKRTAESRNLPFTISDDFAIMMFHDRCHYCHKTKKGNGRLMGIDRVDNLLGYEYGNVTPCCKACNWAKSARLVEVFLRK
jgi:hypothetical protein